MLNTHPPLPTILILFGHFYTISLHLKKIAI